MGAEAEINQRVETTRRPTSIPNPNSITEAQFIAWKRRKNADASSRKEESARKRVEDISTGLVQMNGRELFEREPWVFDNTQY